MCRIAELALDAAVARGECEPLPSGGIVASPVPCCCSEVAAAAEAAAAVATEAAFEAFFARYAEARSRDAAPCYQRRASFLRSRLRVTPQSGDCRPRANNTEVVARGLIGMLCCYGVALEAHGQNALLLFERRRRRPRARRDDCGDGSDGGDGGDAGPDAPPRAADDESGGAAEEHLEPRGVLVRDLVGGMCADAHALRNAGWAGLRARLHPRQDYILHSEVGRSAGEMLGSFGNASEWRRGGGDSEGRSLREKRLCLGHSGDPE